MVKRGNHKTMFLMTSLQAFRSLLKIPFDLISPIQNDTARRDILCIGEVIAKSPRPH